MKKTCKLVTALCLTGFLATSLTPSAVFAQEDATTYVNEQGLKLQTLEVDTEALSIVTKNLKTVRENVFLDEDGFYHLKPELKELLGEEEYEFFVKSNEKINQLIKDGVIKVDEDGQIIKNANKAKIKASEDAYEDFEYFWWGTHYVFNKKQADNFQQSLEDAEEAYDFYSIALIMVPEIYYSKLLSLTTQLLSKRASSIAKKIDRNKTKKGVYCDFGWDGFTTNIYGR
ncbi:hypothetical protein [Brevibacillus laterosporus]|uniref:Uncharacterized protein n=1 Tax=Brevibacillus laterosporus TaxID=1465 RepID=A0AAP3DIA6_BRELA|nr:hypothetical protein [Brevibacillus laterosporus]MCR8981834.1 hypothetical protein [Brevibacillus laterosporus]MCZ0808989.1 hypothetical protein [Brevibacillus laterosporus]MCZ0827383.1 hypothetical protein [Brevibacillus laterosporus]MCZ0853000.1 hypothetical protein [Brevibacillus laterosporus]